MKWPCFALSFLLGCISCMITADNPALSQPHSVSGTLGHDQQLMCPYRGPGMPHCPSSSREHPLPETLEIVADLVIAGDTTPDTTPDATPDVATSEPTVATTPDAAPDVTVASDLPTTPVSDALPAIEADVPTALAAQTPDVAAPDAVTAPSAAESPIAVAPIAPLASESNVAAEASPETTSRNLGEPSLADPATRPVTDVEAWESYVSPAETPATLSDAATPPTADAVPADAVPADAVDADEPAGAEAPLSGALQSVWRKASRSEAGEQLQREWLAARERASELVRDYRLDRLSSDAAPPAVEIASADEAAADEAVVEHRQLLLGLARSLSHWSVTLRNASRQLEGYVEDGVQRQAARRDAATTR